MLADGPVAQVALEDRPGGGKARAAVQVGHARASHGRAADRLERLPGPGRVVQRLFCDALIRSTAFHCHFAERSVTTLHSLGKLELQLNPGRAGSSRMTSRPWPR